jgi:hypothetical protein
LEVRLGVKEGLEGGRIVGGVMQTVYAIISSLLLLSSGKEKRIMYPPTARIPGLYGKIKIVREGGDGNNPLWIWKRRDIESELCFDVELFQRYREYVVGEGAKIYNPFPFPLKYFYAEEEGDTGVLRLVGLLEEYERRYRVEKYVKECREWVKGVVMRIGREGKKGKEGMRLSGKEREIVRGVIRQAVWGDRDDREMDEMLVDVLEALEGVEFGERDVLYVSDELKRVGINVSLYRDEQMELDEWGIPQGEVGEREQGRVGRKSLRDLGVRFEGDPREGEDEEMDVDVEYGELMTEYYGDIGIVYVDEKVQSMDDIVSAELTT